MTRFSRPQKVKVRERIGLNVRFEDLRREEKLMGGLRERFWR